MFCADIYIGRNNTIDDDEKILTECINWAADLAVRFRDVFQPLVKIL